jgi:hypothetical protein
MRLHAAVLVQHVIVFLASAVIPGEMDEPVAPALGIINREQPWTLRKSEAATSMPQKAIH